MMLGIRKMLGFGIGCCVLGASVWAQPLTNVSVAPTIDGSAAEWGAIGVSENTGAVVSAGVIGSQYQWNDPTGDDTGDGDYAYPGASYDGTEADIGAFRMSYDANNIYFLLEVAGDAELYSAVTTRMQVYIDRSDIAGTSTTNTGLHVAHWQTIDSDFDPSFEWSYVVSNRGGLGSLYVYQWPIDTPSYGGPGSEYESIANDLIEVAIPWSVLGGYPTGPITMNLVVGTGLGGESNFTPIEIPYGGCESLDGSQSQDGDADVFDLIGAAQVDQEADLAGCTGVGEGRPIITHSIVSVPLYPQQNLSLAAADIFWANDFVRASFSEPATVATATDPANWSIADANPNDITVTNVEVGTGTEEDNLFLTLSRPITAADEAAGVRLVASSAIEAVSGAPMGTQNSDQLAFAEIIDVTIDASGNRQNFLPDPFIRGSWNEWANPGWPLADGMDPYPDVPGDQTESSDIAGDKVYRGRVFTSAGLLDQFGDPQRYRIESNYDFGGFMRPLNIGYWGNSANKNFDGLCQTNSILVVDDIDNRVICNSIDVELNLAIPTFFFMDEAQATTSTIFVEAGPTYGGDNAIPDASGDLPGERDVMGAHEMTYAGKDADFYYYTTTVTYEAGMPDVSGFRFGVRVPVYGDYPEYQWDFTAAEYSPAPTNVDNYSYNGHIHRLHTTAGWHSSGRVLNMTFREPSFDVPTVMPEPPIGDQNADGKVSLLEINAVLIGFRGLGPVPSSADRSPIDGMLSVDELNAAILSYRATAY
ncbi:hypothetical protein KQI84_11080 [bacterium]|nr:hypothetical protein [bacterium]